jgi:hypothetical protein
MRAKRCFGKLCSCLGGQVQSDRAIVTTIKEQKVLALGDADCCRVQAIWNGINSNLEAERCGATAEAGMWLK